MRNRIETSWILEEYYLQGTDKEIFYKREKKNHRPERGVGLGYLRVIKDNSVNRHSP